MRTKQFALRIIRLVDALPRDMTAKTLGHQLLRSGTSVAANCDETILWMEMLVEAGRIKPARLTDLIQEAGEILAITVASIKSARRGS